MKYYYSKYKVEMVRSDYHEIKATKKSSVQYDSSKDCYEDYYFNTSTGEFTLKGLIKPSFRESSKEIYQYSTEGSAHAIHRLYAFSSGEIWYSETLYSSRALDPIRGDYIEEDLHSILVKF